MLRTQWHSGVHSRTWVGVMTLAWVLAGPAGAQAPHVGQLQKLKVITIDMQVGSTDKESKKVTYSPPPGWYVRSHVVECCVKTGNSSYSVNTVPQNWNWSSEEKVHESYKLLIDMAAKAHDENLANKLQFEHDQALQDLRNCQSSHHALVVDATARGGGFLKGGGCLQLTVTAEMVYVGTDADLNKTIARHRAELKRPEPKQTRKVQKGTGLLKSQLLSAFFQPATTATKGNKKSKSKGPIPVFPGYKGGQKP